MYCVGLTGTIGSGKSTAAAYFAHLGISVIHADRIAKDLTAPNEPAFHAIVQHFGESVLTSTHELNRTLLRQIIFNSEPDRIWLESLLHPLIRQQIEKLITSVNSAYCLIEIPLLTNKTEYPYLNRVLVIKSKPTQQVARCLARDPSSKETICAILDTQKKYYPLQFKPDDIITNDGSLEELKHKINAMHKKYIDYATSGNSLS